MELIVLFFSVRILRVSRPVFDSSGSKTRQIGRNSFSAEILFVALNFAVDTDHTVADLAIAGLPGVARCLSIWCQVAVAVASQAGVARWRTASRL